MTTTRLLRDPTLPVTTDLPGGMITFHHPAYLPRLSTLFSLPRVDKTENADRPFGVHHNTALLACRIVAGNATDGQLYSDRNGEIPVQVGLDKILDGERYYFVVDGNPRLQYPVVPSFRDWPFPHGKVPDSWPSPANNPHSPGVNRCALTSQVMGCKRAHIVPKEEADWFTYNRMLSYTRGDSVNCDANRMHLRADIHRGYDALQFAIVPKKEIYASGNDTGSARYVVHVLGPKASEAWALYHNVPLQNIEDTVHEYHLARFAMTVLRDVKKFILMGHPRKVIRIEGEGEPRTVVLSGAELKEHYGSGGGRASSLTRSRKRRRDEEVDSEGSEDSFGTETEGDHEEDEEHRVRPLYKTGRVLEGPPIPAVST